MKIQTRHPNFLGAFGARLLENCIILLPTPTRTWCSELKQAFNIINQNKINSQPATRSFHFLRLGTSRTIIVKQNALCIEKANNCLFICFNCFSFIRVGRVRGCLWTNGMEVQRPRCLFKPLIGVACKIHFTHIVVLASSALTAHVFHQE